MSPPGQVVGHAACRRRATSTGAGLRMLTVGDAWLPDLSGPPVDRDRLVEVKVRRCAWSEPHHDASVLIGRALRASIGVANPGRPAPNDPAQALVERLLARPERTELIPLVQEPMDLAHHARAQAAPLEVRLDGDRLDVAGLQDP